MTSGVPIHYTPARFIHLTYLLSSVVLLAVYTGNLTATLAVRHLQKPFNSLAEVAADRQYNLMVERGSVHEALFKVLNIGHGTRHTSSVIHRVPCRFFVDSV